MRGLLIAAVLAAFLVARAGSAAAENSPLEQCAVQWRDMTAAGKTVGLDYRTFAAGCLKADRQASAPAAAPAAVSTPAGGKSKPAKSASKTRRPNRMSVCAAQWRQMKAQNTTNGLTYRQFSSQCLSHK